MKSSLIKGITDKEAIKDAKANFNQSYLMRTLVIKRLKDKIEAAKLKARGGQTYENPSWPYIQADVIGYERALLEVISILDEKDG